MLPPWPPWRVLMRRSASRAHAIVPNTLMRIMRSRRGQLISSTRQGTSTTPALLISPRSGVHRWSMSANKRSKSGSLATSACMAQAWRP